MNKPDIRKIYYYFIKIFVLTLFFIASDIATAIEGLPPDIARIIKARKIVVAIHNEDIPPFLMHDAKGNLFGLDLELAYDIARRLGLDLELNKKARTFDELVEIVANRQADIGISWISITLKRAIKVNFTKPYVKLHPKLMINRMKRRRGKFPAWLNSMNTVIGVLKGTSYPEYARSVFPKARIVQYDTWEKAAQNVLTGNIHAVFDDEIYISQWIYNHPESLLHIKQKTLQDKIDPVGMAVHWEDKHLLYWLNLYIDTIRQEGILDKLKNFYLFGDQWRQESGYSSK